MSGDAEHDIGLLGSGPPVSRAEPSSGTSTVVYSCGQHCFSLSLQKTGENVAEPRGNLSHSLNQNQPAPPLPPPLVSLLWIPPGPGTEFPPAHPPRPPDASSPAPAHTYVRAQCWRRPSGRGLRSRPSPVPPRGAQFLSSPSLLASTTGPSSSPRPPREPAPPPARETPRLPRSTRCACRRFVSWALASSYPLLACWLLDRAAWLLLDEMPKSRDDWGSSLRLSCSSLRTGNPRARARTRGGSSRCRCWGPTVAGSSSGSTPCRGSCPTLSSAPRTGVKVLALSLSLLLCTFLWPSCGCCLLVDTR